MNFEQELAGIIGEDGLKELGFDKDGNKAAWGLEDRLMNLTSELHERGPGSDRNNVDSFTDAEVKRYVSAFQRDIRPNMVATPELVERYVRARGNGHQGLVEAVCVQLGLKAKPLTESAPGGNLTESNPFHDLAKGKFTSPETVVAQSGGSKSFQLSGGPPADRHKKGRMGTDRKTGKRRALIQWVSAKRPCGRRAREAGIDVRCWDGKRMEDIGLQFQSGGASDTISALKNLLK